ncbi:imm11 family protein [Modicisalibacter coralii]|uniref:imm11 family protein n=1 Tax=Modicisalibacter coralii TaxID=2304602 RepID=UPI00100B4A32|nr:DUF1629 domain-containing protein [Halomonas coralii]
MTYYTVDATVWATNIFTNSDLIYAFFADNYLEDEDAAWDAMKRANRGEPLPVERFPREMYVMSQYNKYKKLPHIFKAGGFWVVSQRFAEVLRRFELGKTALYPVRLFQHDRTTPFDGEYFCLAFGETQDTFVPEESPRIRKVPFRKTDIWEPKHTDNDYGLAFEKTVLQGVDLWMDKKMEDVFFLSDRLYQDLNAEKLAKPLAPYRCRVVSNRH